ncbi:MAG TPA: TonB-dependent receptor, partial [Thermoanaerobaculia bacterium]
SAHGFNSRWSNKLLVLIDGRTVSTELWGGVRWDVDDVPLDEVARIEVTRGPGGTLWGANAVNGIVNVITKRPIDTQGMLATVSHGDNAGPAGAVRYGGRFGQSGYYRADVKAFETPPTSRGEGVAGGNDGWQLFRGGFRAEWMTRRGSVNVQGEVYRGISGETVGLPEREETVIIPRSDPNYTSGHNLLARWVATQSPRSETTLTAYYDEAARDQWQENERQRHIDLDFAHHVTFARHDATWGAEARWTGWRWASPSQNVFLPNGHSLLLSAFAEDEWRVSSRFSLTAGTKFLHQGQTDRLQPSLRALWTLRPSHIVWGAATRSVRLPTEIEQHVEAGAGGIASPAGAAIPLVVFGNPDLSPEYANTFELGYRAILTRSVSIDVTAYRNSTRSVIGVEPQPMEIRDGAPLVPVRYANALAAVTSGLEALMTVRPAARWDLTMGYSWFRLALGDYFGNVPPADMQAADAPHRQFSVRSFYTVSPRVEIDTSAYYVSAIASQSVPQYLRTDARIAWQVGPDLHLSLMGRNLTDSRHVEIRSPAELPAVTPGSRTIIGMIQWRR